jgi:hypothetical protein
MAWFALRLGALRMMFDWATTLAVSTLKLPFCQAVVGVTLPALTAARLLPQTMKLNAASTAIAGTANLRMNIEHL